MQKQAQNMNTQQPMEWEYWDTSFFLHFDSVMNADRTTELWRTADVPGQAVQNSYTTTYKNVF